MARSTLRFTDQTLAERFRDPKNDGEVWLARELGQAHVPNNVPVRRIMLDAKRYVMDDDACRLAVDISESMPRQVLHQLDAIEMPAPSIWIEFSSRTLTNQRLKYGTFEDEVAERPETARCGMLIQQRPHDGLIQTWCIEDGDPEEFGSREGMIVAWPLSYVISTKGPVQRFLAYPQMNGLVWGYHPKSEDLDLLDGRAAGTMDPSYMKIFGEKGALKIMTELRGWTRLTVAMLALFSTVATIEEVPRPPGQVRLGGSMRPKLKSDRLVIYVPKGIRKPVPWAKKAISRAAQHKRPLHEVSKHWRHLEKMPSTPGWEPVLIGNKHMWRKEIAWHLRGDPALGVVEHRETYVKLNKRYRQITEENHERD